MSDVAEPTVAAGRPRGKLRRELRVWEAFAISIGIMAPTAAMALNGVAPAGLVGRAVPLAFLFASIAIALVSYAFIRLTSYFNHAGSAYALAGVTLGPRAGFFACWALLGTYSAFLAANFAEIGLFGESFFSGIGIWDNPDWVIISLVAAALIWLFAYNDIKAVTRSLLGFEAISVALVTILIIVIYVKVIGGNAPNGQDFTLKPFVPAEGGGLSAVAFASVFGFLSFGGFEGAPRSARRPTTRVATCRSPSRWRSASAASSTRSSCSASRSASASIRAGSTRFPARRRRSTSSRRATSVTAWPMRSTWVRC